MIQREWQKGRNSNTIINCSYFRMKHYTHCSEKTLPDFMQPIYTRGLSKWEASTPPRESVKEIISHSDTAKNLQQLKILNPIGFITSESSQLSRNSRNLYNYTGGVSAHHQIISTNIFCSLIFMNGKFCKGAIAQTVEYCIWYILIIKNSFLCVCTHMYYIFHCQTELRTTYRD